MKYEIDFAVVIGAYFSVFCIGALCSYIGLVWWKACDHRNEGYCWSESIVMAMEYFQ